MRASRFAVLAAAGVALVLAGPVHAQQAGAQSTAARTGPAVGDMAPDFAGLGATRYGRVADPIRLQDYRGKTIVLAFFFRARTTG